MKAMGYIATTILLMCYAALMNGWALAKLWAWFIVPVFSAPPLTVMAAIGLALVVQYLTNHKTNNKEDLPYGQVLATGFVWATAKPLFALAFGAVIKALG